MKTKHRIAPSPNRQSTTKPRLAWKLAGGLAAISFLAGNTFAAPLYWDANGATAGAGSAPTGTWGTDSFWNTDPAGGAGTFGSATSGTDLLHFSAGPGAGSGSSAYVITVDGSQSAQGLVFQSSGAATVSSGTINLGASGIAKTGGAATDLSSAIALQASSTFANNAASGATNQINVTGLISGGHGITKSGGGRLRLANASNSFTGGVTLTGGELLLITTGVVGSGTLTINGGSIVTSQSSAANATANAITNNQIWGGDFSVVGGSGYQRMNGTATLTANRAISVASGQTFSQVGEILDGVNSYSLTKNGTGVLSLSGSNTFDGGVTLNNGTLSLVNANALGTGALTINGGTLSISDAITVNNNAQTWAGDFTIGTFNGTQRIGNGAVTLTGNRAVSVAGFQTFVVGGVIGDSGSDYSLTKNGAGTMTLQGANTYTGNTVVSVGTLVLSDNAQLKFEIDANGINNQVNGVGTLTLNGDFVFDLTTAGVTLGDTWNIVTVGTLTETFGSTFTVLTFADMGGNMWEKTTGGITYQFSEATGNLVVTAVPEPSTWVLLAAGLTLVTVFRRKAQRA